MTGDLDGDEAPSELNPPKFRPGSTGRAISGRPDLRGTSHGNHYILGLQPFFSKIWCQIPIF